MVSQRGATASWRLTPAGKGVSGWQCLNARTIYGQMVYLIPGSDTVVVRFGERVQLLHSTIYDLFLADQ